MTMLDDDLTLEEYLSQLSESDKELLKGFPLTVDELLDTEDGELDKLETGHDLTEAQQARRSEIIDKIIRIRIWAVLEREAKRNQWSGNSNSNNEGQAATKEEHKTRTQNLPNK